MRGFGVASYGDQNMMRPHAGYGNAMAEAAATRAAFAQLAWSQPAAVVVQSAYTPEAYSGAHYPQAQNYHALPVSWAAPHRPHHLVRGHHQRYQAYADYGYSDYLNSLEAQRNQMYQPGSGRAPHTPYQPGYAYARSYAAYQPNGGYPPEYANGANPNHVYRDPRYDRSYGGDYGNYDGYYGRTYNSSRHADTRYTAENARIVASIAQRMGFTREQTVTCIATMLVESRGDHRRVGDGGHSVGLFQLHDRGEGAGMSYAQRCNPHVNASIALSEFSNHRYYGNPGAWAAASQRPKNREQFAYLVNQMLPAAIRLLNASQSAYA